MSELTYEQQVAYLYKHGWAYDEKAHTWSRLFPYTRREYKTADILNALELTSCYLDGSIKRSVVRRYKNETAQVAAE